MTVTPVQLERRLGYFGPFMAAWGRADDALRLHVYEETLSYRAGAIDSPTLELEVSADLGIPAPSWYEAWRGQMVLAFPRWRCADLTTADDEAVVVIFDDDQTDVWLTPAAAHRLARALDREAERAEQRARERFRLVRQMLLRPLNLRCRRGHWFYSPTPERLVGASCSHTHGVKACGLPLRIAHGGYAHERRSDRLRRSEGGGGIVTAPAVTLASVPAAFTEGFGALAPDPAAPPADTDGAETDDAAHGAG